ncbi:MAG: SufE family protein [Anaerolineales bacterium]|nr:SufE family protein [Anaerolineales bacterium]MDW8447121.1 SufE family protein [Anaerolineales bacterium]
MSHTLPPALAEIVNDFGLCERQEKIALLVDYANQLLPPPPEAFADGDAPESVPECMTPVSLRVLQTDGRLRFYFDVPPDAPLIRGYAAIMQKGLWDATPEEILRIPADFYHVMGLEELLTPQRLNGLTAILAHVKRIALRLMQKPSSAEA